MDLKLVVRYDFKFNYSAVSENNRLKSNKEYVMNTEEIEKNLIEYININEGVLTALGKLKFTNSNRIGQGGNGLVYLAKINEKDIAIKFLISNSERKLTRFKSEYFNTNYVRNELCNIVNMIHYEELKLQEGVVIPYIIMSPYSKNLKKYRNEKDEIREEEFVSLIKFLFSTLNSIHKKGIIHRDIKPENILVDKDEKFVLTDFGIAHYEKDDFPIDNKTKKGERLANIEFSAPEQINNQYEVTQAADIYSMAQIMYWFIFGTVNRGTGAEYISQKYNWEDAYIYDSIINKCLRNNPTERFQSIDEIIEFYKNEKSKNKELDPFEDMHVFHRAILSVVPEFYNHAFSITDKDEMCELFNSIFGCKYNQSLEFNTGIGNNPISSIIKLENDDFLMGARQLNIRSVWGLLTDDVYDDILLLEIDKSLPYVIDGKEYHTVAVIENEDIVPYEAISSGYIRYKGKVHDISDLKIQERFVGNDYKVIAIAPFHSCTIIEKNDRFMEKLQTVESLQQQDIYELKEKIHMNRTYDVSMRL